MLIKDVSSSGKTDVSRITGHFTEILRRELKKSAYDVFSMRRSSGIETTDMSFSMTWV